MKKITFLLLAFFLCLSLSSCDKVLNMAKSKITGEEVSQPPEDYITTIEGEEYTYELYDEYVRLVEYVGEATEIFIPAEMDERPVTTIGTLCFFEKKITSVVIPESVKIIESSALYYADALKSITIPDTVEVLESRAFGWCNALETVVIGKGIKEIPDFCFNHCVSLTTFDIPENIVKVGVRAFSYCDKLERVTAPESVATVGDLAFVSCPELKFVVMGNNNIELGKDIITDSPKAAIVSEMNSGSYNYCIENQLLWTENVDSEPSRLGNE